MRRIIFAAMFAICTVLSVLGNCLAAPDQYVGDTAIYGGAVPADPNVLIILDNSGSMNDVIDAGITYDPATAYSQTNTCGGQPCQSNAVYRCTSFGSQCTNWSLHVANVSSVTTSCGGANPRDSLLTTGQWSSSRRRLDTTGACARGNGNYALGNWINWRQVAGPPRPKIDVAKEVVTSLLSSTSDMRFGVMIFNTNQGGRLLSYNGYTASVKDMDARFSSSLTNRQALINAVNSVDASTWTPLGETLYEAMRYYKGQSSQFNSGVTYTSPIQAACQKNYVVLVTDGMSTQDRDPVLRTICNNGDCDGDSFEPANDPAKTYTWDGSDYLDDVARYMNTNDMSSAYRGTQNVVTYTVGFGLGGSNAGAVKLLQEAAANGGGQAFLADNQAALADTLSRILTEIFVINSAFVAPVAPVSPENRTYTGRRVYLGFFKPESQKPWKGNLKKYGIDNYNQIVDKNNVVATNSDGSFKDTAISFWSTDPDGGDVDSGGAGDVLMDRTSDRNIYTYMVSSTALTNVTNAFDTSNNAITATTLDVATSTERNKLINFVRGTDAYDDDGDNNISEKRAWILGDILHSKPLVVNYASYALSQEGDCTENKTMIYVGGNDGMLHAFKDCDGSEAWAFIPPDLLPNLKYLRGNSHTYFVDASPVNYIYDANGNGTIESGDKAIIMFGERRGGGKDTAPTGGFYYALDVTNPAAPVYLWRLSNTVSPSGTNTDYSELAETWSDPKIGRVRVGSADKIVAFIGAGYDNLNEDRRYGATQTFPAAGPVDTSDTAGGVVTSPGTSSASNPTGRGVYAVEIATLSSSGVPSFGTSGYKVWGYTRADNAGMTFSIPSEMSIQDTDYNGYIDRLYVGDTGGNIWRFDVGSTSTSNWTARKIFASNPGSIGSADVGRKIFYRPSVTFEMDYQMIFFGTGDREHPLNTAVMDRMYAIKDTGQTSARVESDLTDVTADTLQASSDSATVSSILSNLSTSSGWYIKLDEHLGEKVLSPPLVLNRVAYYTTYAPNIDTSLAPCNSGNLGTGRIYAMNYKTGEAAINYDISNDGTATSNTRATQNAGEVLLRNDRVKTLGSGLPSGAVALMDAQGDVSLLVGIGGGLVRPDSKKGGGIIPLYWRKK